MKRFLTVIFAVLIFSTVTQAQNCITLTQGSFSTKESYVPVAAFDSLELQVSGCTPGTYEIAYNGIVNTAFNTTVVAPATSFIRKVKVSPPPAINQFQVKKVGEATCVSNFTVFLYPTALPVKLTSFTAQKINNGKVEIIWKVELDIDADRYEIERSADGQTYSTAALIFPQNQTGSIKYVYIDVPPIIFDAAYYRLKMINKNGFIEYSNATKVTLTKSVGKGITIFPNPISNVAYIKFDGLALKAGSQVSILNFNGQYVLRTTIQNSIVDVSSLRQGTYVLELMDSKGVIKRRRIIKQ